VSGPRAWIAAAATAVAFLTRIPVGPAPFDLRRAALWFPAVGLLVGGIAALVFLAADAVLRPEPAVVLALLAAVLVTGGFHEDGLADTADGIGAHVPRERKLEILRDSRVGTFGALAVVFPLLLAFAVLPAMAPRDVVRALVCAHVLARWSTLAQARLLPFARTSGLGTAARVGTGVLVAGSAYTVAIVLALAGPAAGAAAIAGACVTGAIGGAIALRALGGVSGDTFGAVNKLTEVTTYAVLSAVWLP
jgi:adenosylcobinamide-GDP ribazoletransferase